MTAIAVTFNGTRIHNMDSATGLTLGTIGGGAAAGVETTWFWQAVAFIARKVTSTASLAGFTATMAATTDLSTGTGTYQTLIMKYAVSTASDLASLATPGLRLRIGNDGSNHNYYDVEGGDTYVQDKLFKFIAIDPNLTGYRTGVVGTPAPATLDYYAIEAEFVGGGAKDLNVGLDAIDAVAGLSIVSGTGADPAGTFALLSEWDIDTDTRRYAIVNKSGAGVDILGKIAIGSATETRFVSPGEIVVFLDNFAAAGWCGLDLDLTHNTTLIDLDGCTLIGKGDTTTTDTRPVNDVSGAGTSAAHTAIGAAFNNWGYLTLTDKCDYTNAIIINSGIVDIGNGALMVGASVLLSTVAADIGALLWDDASDPDGTLDNMTFSKGANAHHAIDFGTNITSALGSITLRGVEFTDFGSTDDANDSTVRFLATTGALTLNLIGCTVGGAPASVSNFSVDDAAGITITVNIDPVDLTITVKDKITLALLQNVQTSIYLKDSPFTELMNEDTNVSGVATESYSGSLPVDIVWKTRKSEDTDSPRYKADSGIATVTTAGFTLDVLLEENPVLN